MANVRLIPTGSKFGRLTFVDYAPRKDKYYMGNFVCDCGNKVVRKINKVRNRETKSCGCLNKELAKSMCDKGLSVKHGLFSKNSENYSLSMVFNAIKARCYNKNVKEYKHYGGRGITMCDEWFNSVLKFHEWCLSNGYKKGLHIDRINNNGNYEPNNCRFVTSKENMNNTRANINLSYYGEKLTLAQVSELTGITAFAIQYRINKKGMTVEQATSYIKP